MTQESVNRKTERHLKSEKSKTDIDGQASYLVALRCVTVRSIPLCRADGSLRKTTLRPPKPETFSVSRWARHVSSREPSATDRLDLLHPHLWRAPDTSAEAGVFQAQKDTRDWVD